MGLNKEAQVFKDEANVVNASTRKQGMRDIAFVKTTFKEHEDGDFTFETWEMEFVDGEEVEQDDIFYKISEELEVALWDVFDELSAEGLQGYDMVFDIKKGRLHEHFS